MKTLSTLFLLITIALASFGQMEFEKGYLINNENERKDCLIKNEEWKSNPVEFTYKLNEKAVPETGNLKSVREFGIANSCKYVNASVKIDLQAKPAVGAKNEVVPYLSRERLFLKVILEGKAKLYGYEAGKLKRFFYSLNDSNIIQLTYLEAYVNSTLIKNTSYQQQLWSSLKTPMATMASIKAVNYTEKDLSAYFREYNSSFGGSTTELAQAKRKSYFNLKATAGLDFSGIEMNTVISEQSERSLMSFNNQMNVRMGLEAELILPFNKYHWGVLFEPNYHSVSGKGTEKYGPSGITCHTIEFPVGLRYYFPVSENTKVFVNGFIIPAMTMNVNSSIRYFTSYSNMVSEKTADIESAGSASVGAGVEHKRFSFESRYFTTRNLFNNHPTEYANFNRFSFILGYKFLKTRFK